MIAKHYAALVINVLIIAACIGAGLITFGVPLSFDILSTVFFLVIAFFFRSDINIKTVCLLLMAENVIINLVFVLLADVPVVAITAYTMTAIALFYMRSDKLAKLTAALFVVALGLEFYWYATGYHGPQMYFYFFKISVYLLVRFLLLYRPHGLNYFLDSGASILRLDWFVYQTKAIAILVEFAMIIEYMLRHTLAIKPMLMYQAYEYIQQGLGVWVLWLIIREALKLFQQKRVTA